MNKSDSPTLDVRSMIVIQSMAVQAAADLYAPEGRSVAEDEAAMHRTARLLAQNAVGSVPAGMCHVVEVAEAAFNFVEVMAEEGSTLHRLYSTQPVLARWLGYYIAEALRA